jgi:hypothetical protein
MERIAKLSFVSLCGTPPPGLDVELDELPSGNQVLQIVESAFAPFCVEGVTVEIVDTLKGTMAPLNGLHLIYFFGHAWWVGSSLRTLLGTAQQSTIVDGPDLFSAILKEVAPERTVVILDCCFAQGFNTAFQSSLPVPRLVVYAAGASESAISLHGDRGSRLSLAIHRALRQDARSLDLTGVVIEAARALSTDGVVPGQSVTYSMNGAAVVLARSEVRSRRRRERTVSIIRNSLLITGAVTAALLGFLGWFYWDHVLVEVGIDDLRSIASGNISLEVLEQDPDSNRSDVVASRVIDGHQIRLWVPARDLILRIDAQYRDSADRGLSFPTIFKPGFSSAKAFQITLPSVQEIQAHPNMAYIPVTHWIHGQELEPMSQTTPFWIDLRPPTVQKYLPIARSLMDDGVLKSENSFLLTATRNSSAIDAVGLGQVRSLNRDLGAVFGVIASATSQEVSAPGDIVVGAGKAPCPTCPAVMTRLEAGIYCAFQKKRLPTDLEWELAVRGVDGRLYPWGNRFDKTRANVPGLPQKGDPSPSLKPVDAYPSGLSPFGLVDTVGNAGDWVTNESGAYERIYMGATYRFNPEDATAFRLLPVTDSDYLVQEITARCLSESRSR